MPTEKKFGILPLGGISIGSPYCFLLIYGETAIIIDMGGEINEDGARFVDLDMVPDYIKKVYVFITHGHFDHIGSLPMVVDLEKKGIKIAGVYMHKTTWEYGNRLHWPNTISIPIKACCDGLGIRPLELYKRKLAENGTPEEKIDEIDKLDWIQLSVMMKKELNLPYTYDNVQYLDYQYKRFIAAGDEIKIGENIKVRAVPAAHIMGGLGYVITLNGKIVYFTGDMSMAGTSMEPFGELRPEDIAARADYAVGNFTYLGITTLPTLAEERERYEKKMRELYNAGRRCMAPVFATSRITKAFVIHKQAGLCRRWNKQDECYHPMLYIDGQAKKGIAIDFYAMEAELNSNGSERDPGDNPIKGSNYYYVDAHDADGNWVDKKSFIEKLLDKNLPYFMFASSGTAAGKSTSHQYIAEHLKRPNTAIITLGHIIEGSELEKLQKVFAARDNNGGGPVNIEWGDEIITIHPDCIFLSFQLTQHATHNDCIRLMRETVAPNGKIITTHCTSEGLENFMKNSAYADLHDKIIKPKENEFISLS